MPIENKDRSRCKILTAILTKHLRIALLVILATLCNSSVFAQGIRIRLLNGRNGHPIKDCLNVWTSPVQRTPFVVRTQKNGIAVVVINDRNASEERQIVAPCKAVPTSASIAHADTIGVWPDLEVDCRPRNEIGISPTRTKFYSVDEILKIGVAVTNTCGKFKTNPVPGELIFYVRPAHWWEALSR